MHETMIAQSLLAAISEEAKKQNAKPVSARISCGMLNAVNDEILCFAFEAAAKGTLCEGVRLEIEHKAEPDSLLLLEEIEFETD
jgi:Zn finger protein HypA/HybF involved in hydrogenase expression